MSSLQQMFPFSSTIVRSFLNWKQVDEEDTWRDKAVETLIKKLKRSSNEHYATLQVVLNSKSEDTPCIAIGRSQDGRVQVSHKKMLPHVMCCRIFRWPDLQSHHELRSLASCQYPADRRVQNKVCVNPYHYARVDYPTKYPPVVTLRSECGNSALLDEPAASPSSNYSMQSPQPAHMQQTAYSPSPSQQPASPTNSSFSYMQHPTQHQPNALMQQHQLDPYYASNHHSPMGAADSSWYSIARNPADMSCHQDMATGSGSQFESQSPPPGYTSRELNGFQQPMDVDEPCDEAGLREPWCQITYAELNQKIGMPFKGSSSKVIVDGFTNPSIHRRFSLGVLSNINRNSTIETTRRAIGAGVCLENNEHQILVDNLSDRSIFFHSKNFNVENQQRQHEVVKIEPHSKQKIFDQRVFENLVQEAQRLQDGSSYERLFSLTEHCIIKMSFVKGWGSKYQRQDVTSTPCWIEIHLLKPYALIDQYLRQVGRPMDRITSTS